MSIIFETPGEIDPRAITTFGVSSKEGENPIGFFGTGLKYAIAILLRNGQEITIHSCGKEYKFDSIETQIRSDKFSIIRMNGVELGFTTHVGANWELWQAYRELWSNTIDEGGKVYQTMVDDYTPPDIDKTIIIVSGRKFQTVYEGRGEYILESTPLETTNWIDIHPGESKHVYFRNMLVKTLDVPSLYTYNINVPILLTEDRTAKWDFETGQAIASGIKTLKNKNIIENTISKPDTFEDSLNYRTTAFVTASDEFLEVAEEIMKNRSAHINPSVRNMLIDSFRERLTPESNDLNHIQLMTFSRAKEFCAAMGFPVTDYEIIITESLGSGVLGLAENGKIYLSFLTFNKGTKYVAGTLIEEFIHLRYNMADQTREMQNWLFDKIVSLGEEHIWKAPL